MVMIKNNRLFLNLFLGFLLALLSNGFVHSQEGTCSSPNASSNIFADAAAANTGINTLTNSQTLTTKSGNGTQVTVYYTVTSSAGGGLGFLMTVSGDCPGTPTSTDPTTKTCYYSDGSSVTKTQIDNCNLAVRTSRDCKLYPQATACAGTGAIPYDTKIANSSYSSTFNPEWTSLTPNTTYVLAITFNLSTVCSTPSVALAQYSPPSNSTCSACATPTCTVSSVSELDLATARTSISTQLASDGDQYGNRLLIAGENTTICVPVKVLPGSTTFGMKQKVTTAPSGCATPSEEVITYKLTSTSCGAPFTPTRTNATPVSSGFNPEWDNLAPGDYTFCYTVAVSASALCATYEINGLGYYNVAPPTPTCKPVDFEFYDDAGLSTKHSGTSFTCAANPVYLAPKDVGTLYFGASSSPDSGWPFPVIVVDVTATSGNLNSNNTTINIYDAVTGSLVDSSPIGDGTTNTSLTGSNFHFFAKPGGYTFSLDKSNTNSGTYSYTAYDIMSGTVIGSGTLTITGGAESAKSVVLKPTNFNAGFTCATCGPGGLIQGIAPQYLDELGIGTFDPKKAGVGTHRITYTWDNGLTGALNCKGTSSIDVTVTGGPTITPSALPAVCQGTTSTTMAYTSTGTPTQYSIDWNAAANTAGFVDVTNTALTATPQTINLPAGAASGTYTGSLTVKNAAGCSSAAQNITVTINAKTTPTFAAMANVCQNATAPVLPTSSTNTPAITGTWAPAVSTANLGTTTYTFTPGAGQCANTATNTITVATPVTPTFAAIPAVCQGATAPTLPTSSTNTPAITGTWSPVVSTASAGTTTYTFTPTTGQCATTATTTVTVNAKPTVTVPSSLSYCAGATVPTSTFTSTPTGATFAWTNSGDATIGVGASGTGNIASFTAVNATATAKVANISVIPTLNSCAGTASTFTITVNPKPTVTVPSSLSYCAGATVPTSTFTSAPTGATFAWTNSGDATIGVGASGSGNIASFTAVNATAIAKIATISVTPTLNTCIGTATSFTITVNPKPTVTVPSSLSYCHGATVPTSTFTSTPAGATFAWTNSGDATIGVGASGSGNIASFTAANTTATAKTANISVIPTLNSCAGTASSFTITVNPTVKPSINCITPTSSSVTFNWGAVPGATSYTLSGDVTATGYTQTSKQLTGMASLASATITVLPVGTGCFASETQTCTATNCPSPQIDTDPIAVSKCEGLNAAFSITASGAPVTYEWQVSVAGGAFTALSNGGVYSGTDSKDLTISNITGLDGNRYRCKVTETTTGVCSAISLDALLTVYAIPAVTVPTTQTFCAGATVPLQSFTSTPSGATFDWSNTDGNIGITTSGSGNINSFTATNTGATQLTGTITVTPTKNGCIGTPASFDLVVNPSLTPVIICGTPSLSSVTFDWSPALTGATSYSLSYTINGLNSTTETTTTTTKTISGLNQLDVVDITITTTGTGCYVDGIGSCQAINCTSPTFTTTPTDLTVCDGDAVSISGSSTDAASIQWQFLNPMTGNYEDIASMTNPTLSYTTADMLMNGSKYRLKAIESTNQCPAYTNPITLTVNAKPVLSVITDIEECDGVLVPLTNLVSDLSGTTYDWINDNTATGVAASGTAVTDFASFTTTNTGNTDLTSNITVTPSKLGCIGDPVTFKVIVKPTVKPVFNTPIITTSSVTFKWNAVNGAGSYKIDTAITSNTAANAPASFKPAGTVASNEFLVGNMDMNQKAFITVTPEKPVGSTAKFCPVSDKTSAISLNCSTPIITSQPSANPVCEGAPISLSVVNDASIPAEYLWQISVDGGSSWTNVASADFGTSGTQATLSTSISKGYMNNALIKVILTEAANPGSCPVESNAVTLTVNELPTATISEQNSPTCVGTAVTPTISFNGNGGTAPYTYDYTIDNVALTTTSNLTFTTDNVIVDSTIVLTKVTDSKGCSSTIVNQTEKIIVHSNPDVKFHADLTEGCSPLLVSFYDDTENQVNNSVVWDFDGSVSTTSSLVKNTFGVAGIYSISLTVTDANNCTTTLRKDDYIEVKDPPVAKITVDKTELNAYDTKVKYDSKLSQNATKYEWTFGDGSKKSYDPAGEHDYDPQLTGRFNIVLMAYHTLDCVDYDTLNILYPEEVIFYIPNTFTPNGDENNNTFQPIFYSGYDPQDFELSIYDRWGQLVFQTKNPKIGWDGTYGDKILNDGTYIWKLGFKRNTTDEEFNQTGHVNLIR
jgi:gliding motility-associated-like protein